MYIPLIGFTGIDQDYEKPESAELVIEAGKQTIDESVQQVIQLLQKNVSINLVLYYVYGYGLVGISLVLCACL